MHLHRALIHGLEDNRIGGVLEFDVETQIFLDHDFENMSGHTHRRPVRHPDYDFLRHSGRGRHYRDGGRHHKFLHAFQLPVYVC